MTKHQLIITALRSVGCTYREIADLLGVSYASVRLAEQRALAHTASA